MALSVVCVNDASKEVVGELFSRVQPDTVEEQVV